MHSATQLNSYLKWVQSVIALPVMIIALLYFITALVFGNTEQVIVANFASGDAFLLSFLVLSAVVGEIDHFLVDNVDSVSLLVIDLKEFGSTLSVAWVCLFAIMKWLAISNVGSKYSDAVNALCTVSVCVLLLSVLVALYLKRVTFLRVTQGH